MRTIQWLRTMELETGGLAAWAGQKAYPECTGYLIPTLLEYNEAVFAKRLGEWLVSIQNADGSFDGLDGVPRSFDTGACMEGLRALGFDGEAKRADEWLRKMLFLGRLRIHAGTKETEQYNLRPLALLDVKISEMPELTPTRTHYRAYALEGLYNMGFDIAEHLKAYAGGQTLLKFDDAGGSDTCATAQIAVLCLKNGIPCDGLVDAVRKMVDFDGGVFHGSGDKRKCLWTAKYYLDMETLCRLNAKKSKKYTKRLPKT